MFGLMVLISAGAVAPVEAQNPPPAPPVLKKVKIAFPEAMFRDVPKVFIDVAAKPFQDVIQKEAALDATLEIAADYKVLAEKLKAGKLDIAVFHGFEYAWVKDTPGLTPLVVAVPSCGTVQACLVVHVNSKAKGPDDLKGACVAVPRGSKAHCLMFLQHLRDQPQVQAGNCCPVKAATPPYTDEVLDELVANKPNAVADAAIVDISALKAYQANKPGLGMQLKVLVKSEALPAGVIVYRKDALTPAEVAKTRAGLMNCAKSKIGRAFLQYWNLDGFKEVDANYKTAVANSLEKYPAPAPAVVIPANGGQN
jgi:ABC-type phosphate/phosphonate transport system substrate-binding protein